MGAHESAGKNDSEGGISAVAEAVIEKHKQEQNKMAITDKEVSERNGKNGTSKSADNSTVNKKCTPNAIVVEGSASNSNSKNNISVSKDDLQTSESTHKFEPLRLFLSPNPLVSNPTFSNVDQLAQEPFTQMATPHNSDIAGNIEAANLSNANKNKSLNPLVRRVEQSEANTSHDDTNNANGSRRQSSNSNDNGSANASRNISTSSTLRKGSNSNNNSTSTTKAINNSTSKKSDKITSISQYCPDEFGPVVLSDEGEDNMDDDNNEKESFYYYFLNRYGTLSNNAQNGVFANAGGNGSSGQHTITAKELLKMRHAKTASRSTQRQGTKLEGAGGNVNSNANWNNNDDEQAARKSKKEEETNEEVLRSPLADFRDPVDPLVFVPALIAYTREKTQTHFFVDYNGEMRRLYHTTGWYHLKPVRKKKMNKSKRNGKVEDDKSTNTDDNDSTNETASITSDELSSSDIKSQKRQARSRVAQHTTQGKDTFTDNNTDNNNNKSSNKSSLVNTVGKAISPTKNKKLTKTKSKSIFENLHEVRGADDNLDVNKASSKNNNNKEELDDDSEEDCYAHTFPCDIHDHTQSAFDKQSGIRKNSSLINNKNSSYRKNGSSGNIFSRKDDSDTNRLGDQTNNVPLSSHWSKHTLPSKQVQRNGVLPPNANSNFFDVAFRNSPILQKVSTFSRYERRRDRPNLFDDNVDGDNDDEEEQNNHHGNSMHNLRSSLERNNNKSGRQNGSWRKRENNEFNHNDVVDEEADVDKSSNRYKADNTNEKDNRRSDHKNSNNTENAYGEDQEIAEKDSAKEYYLDNHTNKRNGKSVNVNKNDYSNDNDSEYGDDDDGNDDYDKRKMESSFNSLLSTGSGEREMLEHINLEDSIGRRVKFAEGTKYFRVSSHNELKRRLQMRRQMALEEERREWMMQQYMLKHEHSHSRDRYNSKNNKLQKSSNNKDDNTNSYDKNKAKSVNSVCEDGNRSNDTSGSVDIVENNSKQSNSDEKNEQKEIVKNETNTESSKTSTTTTTKIAVTSAPIASNKEQITNEANTPAESNDEHANITEEKQEQDITSQESLQEYEYIYEEHGQEESGKYSTSVTNNHLSNSNAPIDNRCDVAVETREETMYNNKQNAKSIKEDSKEVL